MKNVRVKNIDKKRMAINLASQGIPQKQIAKEINVTEKTVGNWLRIWKMEQRYRTSNLMLFDLWLHKLLSNPKPDFHLIERITKARNEYKKMNNN